MGAQIVIWGYRTISWPEIPQILESQGRCGPSLKRIEVGVDAILCKNKIQIQLVVFDL